MCKRNLRKSSFTIHFTDLRHAKELHTHNFILNILYVSVKMLGCWTDSFDLGLSSLFTPTKKHGPQIDCPSYLQFSSHSSKNFEILKSRVQSFFIFCPRTTSSDLKFLFHIHLQRPHSTCWRLQTDEATRTAIICRIWSPHTLMSSPWDPVYDYHKQNWCCFSMFSPLGPLVWAPAPPAWPATKVLKIHMVTQPKAFFPPGF